MPEETQVIVELTHHSLHALRAVNGTIEAGGECVLENKPAVEAILGAIAPDWKQSGLRAEAYIWPDAARWRLSTDTEAMLDRTGDALGAIAAADLGEPGVSLAYAACGAGDGSPVTPDGIDKWVMAFASGSALERVSEALSNLKVESDGAGPAAFAHVAAVSSALRLAGKGSVAIWDLGAQRSSLVLVTADGVVGTAPCTVGLDAIFAAVQAALRLKFRGAGERLFFNEAYDFTEPGPKVGAIVGPDVRLALGLLPPLDSPPALVCLGLTGKQAWFVREVAAVAGASLWETDLSALAGDLGLKFADGAEASFSPTSAGLLALLGAQVRSSDAWRPAWAEAQAPEEKIEPEAPPAEEPEPVAEPEPVLRAAPPPVRIRPSLTQEAASASEPPPPRSARPPSVPKPAGSAPPPPPIAAPAAPKVSFSVPSARPPAAAVSAPHASPPSPFAAPPPQPAAPPARPPAVSVSAPNVASLPPFAAPPPKFPSPTAQQRPPSFSNPGFPSPDPVASTPPAPAAPLPLPPTPAGAMKTPAASMPPPAVTALPFDTAKMKAGAAQAAPPPAKEPPAPRSRTAFYIGFGVVATVVFAGIMVVLDARKERADALYKEQVAELDHHKTEQLLEQEQVKEKEEADAAQRELATAIEITRKQTEDETRRKVLAELEAERLSKLPGTIAVATTPPGASVSIDGAAPLLSPVKLDGVPPGVHSVKITLAGHDSASLTARVVGSQTADLGTVALASVVGALEVSSNPDALEFYVRPASDPTGKPVRSGRAPASFADIPFGDYVVTFTRPGCRDHVEKVTVRRDGTSQVTTTYVDGSLELASDPSGAWVDKDGIRLGTTPLTLTGLTPKTSVFDLTLPGYDPTPVTCEIPEGDTARVSAQLLRKDRIFNPNEVKTPPQSYESPKPELSDSQRKMGAEVLLSLIVDRDGDVRDVEVVKATDDDIARRCQAAVEKWKFRPATAPDDRAVEARIEVPFKFPAESS